MQKDLIPSSVSSPLTCLSSQIPIYLIEYLLNRFRTSMSGVSISAVMRGTEIRSFMVSLFLSSSSMSHLMMSDIVINPIGSSSSKTMTALKSTPRSLFVTSTSFSSESAVGGALFIKTRQGSPKNSASIDMLNS